MLDELVVRNLGILEEARIEPGSGLTVVTGETGAGKTLLLGALRLLLGSAADSDRVGPFGDEASAEGRFLLPDGREVAVSRRLTRNGRSRSYLDGSIASAAALDEATAGLAEIVGQHDQLSLTRPSELRAMVDRSLDTAGRTALAAYRQAWERWQGLLSDSAALGGDRPGLERELDLLAYQASEIAAGGFSPGDEARLEAKLLRLRNLEALREVVSASVSLLGEARDGVGGTVAALRRGASLDPQLDPLEEEAAVIDSRLGDLLLDLGRLADDLDSDPGELEEAEERWQLLAGLRRKYGPELEDVLAFAERAERRAGEIRSLLERAGRLDADLAGARSELEASGARLTEARRAAAARLAAGAAEHLAELGLAAASIRAEVGPSEPGPWGADVIRLLFASDTRLAPGEIGKVASGGELSRLVLSLRLAGGAGDTPVLAFDEIDAGVGGSTALALGRKLSGLGQGRQVLCVTHLPQVAAFADTHYVVRRDGDRARVDRVDGEARVEELSRMLAGLPDSDRSRDAAKELLALAAGR